ncbi:MAG: HlyD family secretion protein [Nibricoccus sp.]
MTTLASTATADFAPDVIVTSTPAKQRRSLPWTKILLGTAALTIAAVSAGVYFYHSAGFETTDNSFLEGNVHPVSPRVNGTVLRVLVDDNAHVTAGQPLVELDPADLALVVQGAAADLAQARANADQVNAQILRAQADIDAAVARIAENQARLTRASLEFQRMETLVGNKVISQQDFDAARANFDAARATEQSLLAGRTAAEAALAAVKSQHTVALAQIEKAEANLAAAKLQADYTIIRAPSDGRIAKKTVEVGQRLQPGQPMMAIVSDQVWVVANFKESQLAHLRAGAKVDIKVDAIEGHAFHGTVDSFSPGTGAKFSLLPPDNATGNFTKVVQRVPVKILLSPDSIGDTAARLAPGLSAFVKVSIRE